MLVVVVAAADPQQRFMVHRKFEFAPHCAKLAVGAGGGACFILLDRDFTLA